jgi:type I site-specific restriction-modification system R (restriction) subunit
LREGPFDGLVENFTLFSEHKAGLVKIIGQNHQYLGVNNAIASMLEARKLGHGRGGVFWQTQGSGKVTRWCSSPKRCCGKLRATGLSSW